MKEHARKKENDNYSSTLAAIPLLLPLIAYEMKQIFRGQDLRHSALHYGWLLHPGDGRGGASYFGENEKEERLLETGITLNDDI